ncbi:MAG: hypothetical protein Q9217_002010 [Psora testacea]
MLPFVHLLISFICISFILLFTIILGTLTSSAYARGLIHHGLATPIPSTNYSLVFDTDSENTQSNVLGVLPILDCLITFATVLERYAEQFPPRTEISLLELENCGGSNDAAIEVTIVPYLWARKTPNALTYETAAKVIRAVMSYVSAQQIKTGQRWRLTAPGAVYIAYGNIDKPRAQDVGRGKATEPEKTRVTGVNSNHVQARTAPTVISKHYEAPRNSSITLSQSNYDPIPVPSLNLVITIVDPSPFPGQPELVVADIIHCLSLLELNFATERRKVIQYPEKQSCPTLQVTFTPASYYNIVTFQQGIIMIRALRRYIGAQQLKSALRWKAAPPGGIPIAWGDIFTDAVNRGSGTITRVPAAKVDTT